MIKVMQIGGDHYSIGEFLSTNFRLAKKLQLDVLGSNWLVKIDSSLGLPAGFKPQPQRHFFISAQLTA